MKKAINYFEIPSQDLERAKKFYCDIFNINMHTIEVSNIKRAFFPTEDNEVGGAICHGFGYEPSDKGGLIYFNGGNDLNDVLMKVESSNGQVVLPKTLINENVGYFAVLLDTEGNRIALHSPN